MGHISGKHLHKNYDTPESVAAALCRDKFLDGETGLRVLCRSRASRFAGELEPEILDGTRPGIFFDRKSARFMPSWKNAEPWTDEVFEEGGGQATASSRACGMSRVARVRSWSRSSVRRATVCPS